MKKNIKGQIKFIPKEKTDFFQVLKSRVDDYFIQNNLSKHANFQMVFKTIILLTSYIVPFILLLVEQPPFWMSLIIWFVMGIALAGIGMSVMHDANHGAYSSHKWVNVIVGHTLNLLGGSVFNWKLQHNILHHTYTNITYMDDDIDDKLIMRFSPNTEVKPRHKYQFILAFLFYGILTFYWAVAKDFVQFNKYIKNGVNADSATQNRISFLKIVGIKILYFFTMLVVPSLFFGLPFLQVLAGFMLMHFLAGLILTTVFQLAHTVEGTTHPLPNADGNIENNWAIHQLNTTVNFSPKNKLLSWYVGGLNFQVEHHLFPRICHVYYPQIAPIVEQTALEYGIPYLENESFMIALGSHIRLLRQLGKMPDINEALA